MVEVLLAERDVLTQPSALAAGLEWELPRVAAALQMLERRLAGTGQRLHRASSGVGLRSVADAFDSETLQCLERACLDRKDLRSIQAELLRQVTVGQVTHPLAGVFGNAKSVALAQPSKLGLIQLDGERFVASEAVAYSLMLDES